MRNDLSKNINLWNRLFVKKKFNPIYPSEEIQAFQKNHLKKASSKILDCGFGNGRNTFFLSGCGYNIFGIDSSIESVKNIKKKLNKNDRWKFKLNNFTKINFTNNFFNAVIADGVMYYADQENIINGINEIYRVLKKGGVARINLKTNKEKYFEYSKLRGGGGWLKMDGKKIY
jgi:SAM-dependent methyltransferase